MAGSPKLGGKVADIVTRAIGDHQRRRAPDTVRLAMAIQEAFFHLTGTEHRATSGGLYRALQQAGGAEGWAADTLAFLADGHGQWQTLLAGQATGAAMGGGLLSVIQNELAVPIQGLLESNPHGILAPGDLAIAVTRNVIDWTTGESDSAKSGLGKESFRRLVLSNYSLPTLDATMLASHRGEITDEMVDRVLTRAGYDPEFLTILKGSTILDLTPEQLATLVTFGAIDQAAATKLAARSGMSAENFALLVAGNGEPPSKEELLFAYRRGIIDKARLLRGITQGPVRNEWFDVIESLGQVPMSIAEAVEASIQGHLTYDQAKKIATQNGLLPDQFDPLYQTAGSPPGAQAMMSWLRRGLVSQRDVRQALTESRLKPKYVDLILATERVLLPMATIRMAYAHGAITHTRALQLLAEHGYAPEDAAVILDAAHAERTTSIRTLTEGQVIALYSQRAVTRDTAAAMLGALHYTDTDVEWLLDLADIQANRRLVEAATNKVRAAYVGRHITETDAQNALDALHTPPDERDYLLALWDIERSTVTKTLTLAQCTAAVKKGLMDAGEFAARVSAMGYPDSDVSILAGLAGIS